MRFIILGQMYDISFLFIIAMGCLGVNVRRGERLKGGKCESMKVFSVQCSVFSVQCSVFSIRWQLSVTDYWVLVICHYYSPFSKGGSGDFIIN